GQQVTALQFQDSGAASRIECLEGFTCIAVQVDQVSGVGTLIKTGDYVDLVAQINPTFPLNFFAEEAETPTSGEALPVYDPTSVKMLLQGLQVVATLLPPPPAPAEGAAPTAEPGTALTGQQEIVILAVTPAQAEVVRFAQVDGNITLTLRSPKDFVDAQGNQIIPETVVTTGQILKTMIEDFGVPIPEWIIVPGPSPLP
ncbi:MAG TPA: RcpC/CpaB family pilus assembly protein, partial [Candidatus Limnocylindrales bacterium]|nr:RcpC/CpaB family pilus assembly protein [Candidatus Limnocylindrales bacterium]